MNQYKFEVRVKSRQGGSKMNQYKDLLLQQKQQLLDNANKASEEGRATSVSSDADPLDQAARQSERNLALLLQTRERRQVAKIDAALARIKAGTFGVCLDCEEEIEPKRLLAQPASTSCLSCGEKREKLQRAYASNI
jgi:DnaK suppressor protein